MFSKPHWSVSAYFSRSHALVAPAVASPLLCSSSETTLLNPSQGFVKQLGSSLHPVGSSNALAAQQVSMFSKRIRIANWSHTTSIVRPSIQPACREPLVAVSKPQLS